MNNNKVSFFDLGMKFGEQVSKEEREDIMTKVAKRVLEIKKSYGQLAAQDFELGACSVIQYADMFVGEMPIIDADSEISKILTDPNERNESYFGGSFREISKKYDSEGNFIEPKIR